MKAMPSSWRQLQDAFKQALTLMFILFIRLLLRTVNTPILRSTLCLMGLRTIVAEAEKDEMLTITIQGEATGNRHLLPPRHENERERLTIVLDLDETLVCAYNTLFLPPSIKARAALGGIRSFSLDCVSPELDADGKQRTSNVTVFQRPGLAEFLARASAVGELILFTAGLEGYARPLVDRIDPEGRISARLYRPATVCTKQREHVKDLSLLGRDLRRTVIIDNNPFSFLLQPANGIPCVPFHGDDPQDRQLLEVLLPLVQHLSTVSDVRLELQRRFQMPAWFRCRGIPSPDWIDASESLH